MDKNKQYTLHLETPIPQAYMMRQNEIYIGHDAIITIDQLQISNTVNPRAATLDAMVALDCN